jgi:beta-lactam-binding protein with PASTA domain
MKGLISFIFSKSMFHRLFRLAFLWALILGVTYFALKANSRPWSERSVPSVEGLSKEEAFSTLLKLDLVPIHLDSVYSATAQPGSVLEQSPLANSSVKSGRPIYITTFRITPPDEKIGVTEGQDARLAFTILARKGFVVTKITEANNVLDGKVIKVLYKGIKLGPEDRKQRGTEITLVVGEVRTFKVRIPSLTGLNLIDASDSLIYHDLSIGYVEYGDSIFTRNDTLAALVTRQFPSSSRGSVNAGTAIDIYLQKP